MKRVQFSIAATIVMVSMLMVFVMNGCKKEDAGSNTNTSTAEVTATTEAAVATTQDNEMLERSGGLQLPLTKEEVKLVYTIEDHPTWPISAEMPMIKKLQEITGVTLEIQAVPSGTYEDKKNVLLASGDFSDALLVSLEDSKKYGQDLFVPLDEYESVMPNLKAYFGYEPESKAAVMNAQGKYYCVPWDEDPAPYEGGWLYRKDVFEKEGLSKPETTDELYQVLKTLKEKYPDSIPMYTRGGAEGCLMNEWSNIWGTTGSPDNLIKIIDGKAQFGPAMPQFKTMIEYVRRLYDEELISPNYMIEYTKEWEQAIISGKSFLTIDWISRASRFNTSNDGQPPFEGFEISLMMPPKPNDGPGLIKSNYPVRNEEIGDAVAFNKNMKIPVEIALQLFDFIYSPMGEELLFWGIEGETFIRGEDGGRSYTNKVKCDYIPDGEMDRETWGLGVNGFNLSTHFNTLKDKIASGLINDYHKEAKEKNLIDKPQLILSFTEEEEDVWYDYYSDISSHYVENIDAFIVGNKDMSEWESFVDEFENLHVQELIKILQEQYDRSK